MDAQRQYLNLAVCADAIEFRSGQPGSRRDERPAVPVFQALAGQVVGGVVDLYAVSYTAVTIIPTVCTRSRIRLPRRATLVNLLPN